MVLNTVTVSASDINEEYDMCVSTYSDDSQDSEMYLISETQTVLEDGVIETTRLYSSVNPKLRAASGSGTFKNEKELEFSNEGSTPLKYWVQGDFTWNSSKDTAVVSNVKYKHGTIPANCEILNEKKDSKSNQGATVLFGKKYAYIRYSFTFKNWPGFERQASVYLDVNVCGEANYG